MPRARRVALLAALVLLSAAAEARTPARVCRRECQVAIAQCVVDGGKPRRCRRQTLKRCRREGVVVCLPTTTTVSTTTSTTETTSTIVVPTTTVTTTSTTTSVPGPSYRGTASIEEVSVVGVPALGQGLDVDLHFVDVNAAPPPVFEELPGASDGCKVWEYTPAEAADVGLSEGTIAITAGDATPAIPPCIFVSGPGYVCLGPAGAGGTIALVSAPMGLWSLTVAATFSPADVGRYLNIAGAASPANNGSFPIIGTAGANTVVFVNANPSALPEALPGTATWVTIAGAGPIPGATDPGFLADDDTLTVTLTPGGSGHFAAFAPSVAAGDDFVLDTASAATIQAIPTDGSAFSIGCAGAGGTCGTASHTLLVVTTTDGAVPGGTPPNYMPPPVTQVTVIRCVSSAGGGTLTVPAGASAHLMTAAATRIETRFARTNLVEGGPAGASHGVRVGHAVLGYTTP